MTMIENVFEGEWKSEEEYLIKCPYCGDHKTHNHCYINVVKGVFSCHFCGEAGSLNRLLKDHGDGEQVERESGMKEKERHEQVDFTQFKLVTGINSTLDRMALTYLVGRGFNKQEIKDFNVGFSDFGRFYGRVIFPIIEFDKVVSFAGRSFLKAVHPKYLFPRHGQTKLTTNECLWNWDRAMIEQPKKVIITEGIIDAINIHRLGYFAVSIHSKQLGKGQLLKLLKLPKTTEFIVMLDDDAHKEGLKISKVLSDFGRNVKMAMLYDLKDPAELDLRDLQFVLNEQTFPVDVNLAMKVYI